MTTLLLDADIVAYKLAAKSQRSYAWPDQDESSVALDDWSGLPALIDGVVTEYSNRLKAKAVIVCLSCPTAENWRLEFLPTYKGNRKGAVKPEYLQAVKDYLEETYPSYRKPTLEADDIMGILSTMPGLPSGFLKEHPQIDPKARKVIVSEDKDMKTIPGWLWNPAKDSKPWLVSPLEADWWHLYQTLVGDKTDGYSGLPKCGPKGAVKVLGDFHLDPHIRFSWASVVAAYEARGLTEADALTQARVARICRVTDFDFVKRKVVPWCPGR